jgi:hypothetical protein
MTSTILDDCDFLELDIPVELNFLSHSAVSVLGFTFVSERVTILASFNALALVRVLPSTSSLNSSNASS